MAPATLSHKQIRTILAPPRRINIWHGSIRSGKTIASIIKWLHWIATTAPAGALAMIGNTRDTLGRNVLDVIAELDPDAIQWNRGAPTARIMGRLVHIIGASDARAENRVRGLTLAGAYVDEATLLQEAFWTQLLGRLSVPGAALFATTNPDNPAHWLRKKYLKRAGELDLAEFHFELADNPSLTPEYVEAISAEFTGLWYDRFIKGLWTAAEGAIYGMLSEQRHSVAAPDRKTWADPIVAIDYGTSNPTHAVLLTINHQAQQLHAVAEWRYDGREKGALTDGQISTQLQAWLTGLGVHSDQVATILDPSAASFRAQLRADGWAHLRSADNTVLDGIRETANLFAKDRLVIDTKACPHLWDELLGYVWDDKKTEQGLDAPKKVDDHGADALRYGIRYLRRYWRHWVKPADDDAASLTLARGASAA